MYCSRTTRSGARESGFVLATTLLVTTLLTVMLAASFLLVSAEQRTTDNSYGTTKAFALAQAGIENYLARNHGLDTSSTYDSARIALAGGYADVVARRVRPASGSASGALALWVVRSTGVATTAVMAGQVAGTRTIAQFATLNPGMLPARAPLVALNGVQITGNGANPLSGSDLGSIAPCTSPSGGAADTVGVSVPSGGYSASNGQPPTKGIESSFPTWANLYDSTHIDWVSLTAGNFSPDYTIPPASYPGYTTTYNVYYVAGNATVPAGQARGMLVALGNVTMAAGAHWDGIILAGGNLSAQTGNSTFIIHGMVVTGLNQALGQAVPPNQLKRGNAIIQWAWCYTQSSVNSLASLVPIKNAWADTWSTY
jgi:Tfp pilus assembly protein PilX